MQLENSSLAGHSHTHTHPINRYPSTIHYWQLCVWLEYTQDNNNNWTTSSHSCTVQSRCCRAKKKQRVLMCFLNVKRFWVMD